MPDEDKTFSDSFVLDLRIWWRQAHTLYSYNRLYIINQIILAFWLVLTHDLLEDKRIGDVNIINSFLLYLKWQKVLRI